MAATQLNEAQTSDAVGLGLQGMLAGTTVLTLDGALPVEYLTPGDRVLTRGGACRITQIAVTVMHHARMVKITHDALGVGKPQENVTVSAAQGILIRDWRAKALFGAAQAVVPVSRLVDGQFISAETLPEARIYTLVFADPCVIYAGGLELACEAVSVRA